MKKGTLELWVGLFVLIGIFCVGYLTIKLGKMEWIGDNHYLVMARFSSVSGLTTGASVEVAGVQVGTVEAITLDKDRLVAHVDMKIQNGVPVTEDTIASVKTAGLIGDKYIKLTPGGSDTLLKNGDVIVETESALDIEELVSKYVFGGVSKD